MANKSFLSSWRSWAKLIREGEIEETENDENKEREKDARILSLSLSRSRICFFLSSSEEEKRKRQGEGEKHWYTARNSIYTIHLFWRGELHCQSVSNNIDLFLSMASSIEKNIQTQTGQTKEICIWTFWHILPIFFPKSQPIMGG